MARGHATLPSRPHDPTASTRPRPGTFASPGAPPPSTATTGVATTPRPPPCGLRREGRTSHAERVRQITTYADARQWAAELGLDVQGLSVDDADQWEGSPSTAERQLAAQLLDDARDRALDANAASYLGKLKQMLHWLAIVRDVLPTRRLVLPLGGADSHQRAAHNEDTQVLIQQVMRRHGSIAVGQRGAAIGAGQLAAVTSTFAAYCSLSARAKIRDPAVNQLLPRLQRNLRREDGPTGDRALVLGIEPHHLATAHATGRYDRTSMLGIVRHAMISALINVVGRGGEAGLQEGRPQSSFDPRTGFCWGDIDWPPPEECLRLNDGIPFLRAYWFPIKDVDVRRKKVPIPISRRDAGAGDDPRCAYRAILAAWNAREHLVPPAQRATEPFFRMPDGRIATTAHVRTAVRAIATLVGIDPTLVGGKSCRIGGGFALREWCELHGIDAERLLRERGRWRSDIAFIYARMSDRVHLAGSRGIATADTSHATEANAQWVQPA